MDVEKIGKFIKEERINNKLTQNELAKKLHVTDRAVSKWERGKGLPDISLIEELSIILNVSVIDILKGEKVNGKVKENDILDTLSYAKYNTKNKINIIIKNICLVLLIILISSFTVCFINDYYVYKCNIGAYESKKEFLEVMNKKIEIIEGSQGTYSDKEYQDVLKIVNTIKYQIDETSINKNYYYLYTSNNYFNELEIINTLIENGEYDEK